jgi:hypothetical protein
MNAPCLQCYSAWLWEKILIVHLSSAKENQGWDVECNVNILVLFVHMAQATHGGEGEVETVLH